MAIQQHPVPQDISNYKFRLIGDMTIRQFASLGIFMILSVIIYGSPIPFFFRYPLAFIFLLTGIATAFVPVQGRTLDIWIIAFIKSIYSPTQYIWKSTPQDTTGTQTATSISNETTTPQPQTPVVPISTPTTETNTITATAERDLNSPPTTEPSVSSQSVTVSPSPSTIDDLRSTKTSPSPDVQIPTSEPIKIEPKTEIPLEVAPVKGRDSADGGERGSAPPASPSPIPTVNQQPITNNSPQTPPSVSLPIPFTPTTPNTIVGLSLTSDNHILDGVMVEIKKDNLTIRATRSNKLGQFLFARPLENGIYQILAEKDGYTFTPYAIDLVGEIIRPLKIQAVP